MIESKILIDKLERHQREAVRSGEGAVYEGRVLTLADVETKDQRAEREESEKAAAKEAAKAVESVALAAVASGDLVPKSQFDALQAQVDALTRQIAESRIGATVATPTTPAPTTPQGDTVESLVARHSLAQLIEIAKAEGATHESDANKARVAEVILAKRGGGA